MIYSKLAVSFMAVFLLVSNVSCFRADPATMRPSTTDQTTDDETRDVAQVEESAADGEDETKLVESDWAAFLGNNGSAHSSDTVPLKWSDDENIVWKKDLPGTGSSSPIIVGDRLILTCYIKGNPAKRQVLCFNKQDGKLEWSVDYPIEYREDAYRGFLTEHGYASNTAASDGENVFVFFGKGGVHRISLDGKKGWSFDVGKESSVKNWGSATSLLLYKNLVIVNAAEEAKAIIAIDKDSGEQVWRQDADLISLTYGTPRIVTLEDGADELVITVPGEIWGINPISGKLKWFAKVPFSGNVSPSTIVDGQTLYGFGGYQRKGSFAVTAGGKGDVTKSNLLWTSQMTSYVATPVLYEGTLFWIDNKGIASSSSAETGKSIYRERVKGLAGKQPVYASPIVIGDKVFAVTRKDGTIVYEPNDKFKVLEQNKFVADDSDFNASPAISNGKIYLRSNKAIYCIGTAE